MSKQFELLFIPLLRVLQHAFRKFARHIAAHFEKFQLRPVKRRLPDGTPRFAHKPFSHCETDACVVPVFFKGVYQPHETEGNPAAL